MPAPLDSLEMVTGLELDRRHAACQCALVCKSRMRTPIRLLFTLLCSAIATLVVDHDRAAGSQSSPPDAQKSAVVEFSANRQRVGQREITGFSARQARPAQAENLTVAAGL